VSDIEEPRYFVDHDTIHDRLTGQHVDLVEAAGMLSVEPETIQRVAWGVVVKLGAALKNAESHRDRLLVELGEARAERDEAREAAHIVKWADDTRLSARLAAEHREASANWERLQMQTVRERDAAIARANLEAAHHEHLRTERDAARTEAARWERAATDYAKTIGTQHESVARIEARLAEEIAAYIAAAAREFEHLADTDRSSALTVVRRDHAHALYVVAPEIQAHAWKPTKSEGGS
jgi:hypothetical protein